jgi:TP901 family phage tail tape measure protein
VAEVVKGIVDIEINTGNAARELKALQQQINAFNLAINKGNTFQTAAAAKYSSELKDVINASRFFTAETVKMQTAAGALDSTLKKGQATLGSFFNAKFSRNSALFAETMGLAAERARTMQTQFIATSGSAKGMQEALAIRPLAAFNSEMAVAAQRSQILSTMFRQGTTQLINFGKNVQWAGRQLMVGFTLPLASFGMVAGKTFRDLEKQVVSFKKVYGDIFTTPAELQGNLDAVMGLAKEYTKYGIAVKDTVGLGAQAAAAGRRNKDLTDAVSESTRLATLGQMDQNEALKTTIALQSAFKLSGQDLSNAINFLNIVENQTVVSLQDLAAAIPKVAPVIVGLGGDVKDLSVFLAAMQEGGVSAEQGANALKSGLASLINPSKAAKETLGQLGINMDYIVNQNRGDLMGTVMAFSRALGTLDDFSRQQALEKIFGKYQYARLGALFDNLTRQGSQAQQVMDAAGFSVEQMAASADKELKTIEQSFGVQLTAAIEKFKLSIAPLGQMFLQMAIPVVNFFTKIVEGFNNLPDFTKRFAALATIITGLVIPAGTMFFGLLMNLSGTLAKLMQGVGVFTKGTLKGGILGGIQAVSQSMKYMSLQELDSALAAKQLGTATMSVNDALLAQVSSAQGARQAINGLADTYGILIARMAEAASISKFTLGTPGAAMQIAQTRNIKGGFPRQKFATGGVVPGTGNQDTVPAMLTPGEFVVTKKATNSIGANFLKMLNGGKVGGYSDGGFFGDYSNMQNEKPGWRQLQAGLKDPNSKIRMSSGVIPGDPVIVKSGSSSRVKKQKPSSFTPGMYNPDIKAGTEELLSNAVYLFDRDANQAMNGSKKPGLPVNDLISRLQGKGPVDNPYIYLDEYSRSTGNKYSKMSHQNALLGSIDELSKGARPGQEIRVVDGPKALERAMRKNPNAYYITLKDIYNNKGVMSSLGGIKNSVLEKLTVRGTSYRHNKGKEKTSDTKPFSQAYKKQIGSSGRSYMTLRKTGLVKKYLDTLKSRGKGTGFEATHFFAKGGSVPSLLTPGEFVVGKEAAAKNRPFLEALNGGMVNKYAVGGDVMVGPQTRRQAAITSFKGGLGTAGGVAAGASIPLMFAGQMMAESSNQFASSIGNFVNSMTPALFGLQLLGPLLPKLANPIGLAIGATAALAYGTYKVVAQIKKLENSGAALTRAMYGSSKTVDQMAAAFGRQTSTQQVTSTLAQRVGGAVGQPAQEAANQFIGTDAGKQLLEDIDLVKKAGGDTISALKNQLARSVVSGAITAEEARGVAIEIGKTLNDQDLAVNVSAQLTQLIGQNGELIKGNEIDIIGKITPTVDMAQVNAITEQMFAQNTSGFFGGLARFFTDDDVTKNKIAVNLIAEATVQAFKTSEESVSNFKLAVLDGSMSLEEYNKKTNELGITSQQTAQGGLDAIANKLKVSREELNKLASQKSAVGGRGGSALVPTGTAKLLEAELKKTKTAAQSALKNMGLTDTMVEQISKGLSSENFVTQMEQFGMLAGGALTDEMEIKLAAMLGKGKYYFDNLLNPGGKGGTPGADLGPDLGGSVEGEKSALQLLLERIALTKQQTAAVSGLVANGLNPEAAATLTAEEATQLYNKAKRDQKDIIKTINDDSIRQRVLTAAGLSQDQKAINLNNLRVQGMNLEIAQNQKQIDQVSRLNELDTRQVSIRQKALEVLGKKEKSVNDLYANRTKALDAVAQANERANQQQRNSIALASALTSGDFGAAATAAAQMTSDSASNQIQDTKTALEAQRQAEISALTTDINGKLMTRAEIEAQIDTYNENIYQRTQSTLQYEDSIYTIKSNIAALERENDLIQQKVAIEQVKVEASMANQEKYSRSIRDYYAQVLEIMNKMGGKGKSQTAAYGGSIQKLMYGGLPKGSTQSPPSLKFANGNIVPGTGMTDKVPALLTPGEFVVRKSVAETNMPLLKSLNSNVFGAGMSVGSSNISPIDATTSVSNVSAPVYNYNVNVNVADTNASPNEIADVVMNKIRMTKDRNVRGNRY